MYRPDTGPTEGRRGHGCEDGAFWRRDDAQLPLALGGGERHVLHQLLDVEPFEVGVVPELEHRPAVLDPVRVDIPAEELSAVQAARDRNGHLGAGELRLPEQRLLPVDILRRHVRPVRHLERDHLPVVGYLELELDEVGALVRGRIDDGESGARNLRRDARDRAPRQLLRDLLRLRVADEHLGRHFVGRAAADRVVRRVLEHARPGLLQEPLRPGSAVQHP